MPGYVAMVKRYLSIRQILRHVGNAEAWYVSRLVDPASLPPEWEDDEALPIFEFLEMERRTTLARLRQLTDEELSVAAFVAGRKTFLNILERVSDEAMHRPFCLPWGKRATFRRWTQWRFRHDAGHAQDLKKWRQREKFTPTTGVKSILLAVIRANRQELLSLVTLVREAERASRPVCGQWTLKDLLGNVADGAWYGVEGLDSGQSRRSLTIEFPGTIQEWNERHAAARQDQAWEQIWADFCDVHQVLVETVSKLSQDDLAQPLPAPWNPNSTVYQWLRIWPYHEREHAVDLRLALQLPNLPKRLIESH